MKSLQNLLLTHILVGIFITFFLVHGHITRPFLIVFLLALPVSSSCLEQGTEISENQIPKNTPSKRISPLYSLLVCLPQLLTNSMDWRYLVFLTICIIFSLIYCYTLYQLFREANTK